MEQKWPANHSVHANCAFIVLMGAWWNCAHVAQAAYLHDVCAVWSLGKYRQFRKVCVCLVKYKSAYRYTTTARPQTVFTFTFYRYVTWQLLMNLPWYLVFTAILFFLIWCQVSHNTWWCCEQYACTLTCIPDLHCIASWSIHLERVTMLMDNQNWFAHVNLASCDSASSC